MNLPLRLPVTDLDTYRLFTSGDWMDQDKLIASITHTEPRNALMQIGIDFEDVLMGKEATGGYHFDAADPIKLPRYQAVQVSTERVYVIGKYTVTLAGKLDAVHNNVVHDWKTTTKAVNYDKYAESWQWRCYLDMTGYRNFVYQIFQLSIDRKDKMHCTLADHYPFRMAWYPAMHDEIVGALHGYVGLLELLRDSGKILLTPRGPKLPPVAGRAEQ